jgi:hypothetical protein
MAFAAGGVNVELSASALEIQEAQAVDFNLKLADFPESLCEFEWDFGDGCVVTTSGNFASHAFAIEEEGRTEKEEFTILVKVKENSTVLAEASLKISVRNSPFGPAFWQPMPCPSTFLDNGREQTISLEFRDDFGSQLPQAEITSFSASIKGQKIDLNWADKDSLTVTFKPDSLNGTFKPDASFGQIEKITITAQARDLPESKKFSFPVFFESPAISVSSPFGEGSSLEVNSKIGRLEFDLKKPDGKAPDKGDFTAWLLSGTTVMEKQKLSFNRESEKWSAELSHLVLGEGHGALEVTVSGQDESGIAVEKNSFIVPAAKPEPGEQKKPESKIEFISPMDNAVIDANAGFNRLELQISGQVADVNVILLIDGNLMLPITLSCDESGVCTCENLGLDPPLATGKHTLIVKLTQPPFSGSAEISIEIMDFAAQSRLLVLLAAVLAAGLAIFTLFYRKKHRLMEKRSVKNRLEEIAELEKNAKVEFYKRHISESGYREKLLKLEQEKEQMLKKSGKQKKEKK